MSKWSLPALENACRRLRSKSAVNDQVSAASVISGRSRSTVYRQNRKLKDPESYTEYKQKDNERKKQAYTPVDSLTDDAQKEQRSRWAKWKRNMREKKKKNNPENKHEHIGMSMTDDERRAYNRQKKRESRSRKTAQHLRRDKELDRARKASANTTPCTKPSKRPCSQEKSSSSRATRYRQLQQLRSHMPASPTSYAQAVETLVINATPRKKSKLSERGINPKRNLEDEMIASSVKNHIGTLKTGTEEKRRQLNNIALMMKYSKSRSKQRIANRLGVTRKILRDNKPKKKKKRKDALSQQLKNDVVDFWESPRISRILPLKKRVKKGKVTHLLEHSCTEAYKIYKEEHPDTKIGYSMFVKLKPSNVRTIRYNERIICCCKVCGNAKLMLNALNTVCNENLKINAVAEMVMCTEVNEKCLNQSCRRCPSESLRAHYQPFVDLHGNNNIIYRTWDYKSHTSQKTGKVSRVLNLLRKEAKMTDLVNVLSKDVCRLGPHLFRARWQQNQYSRAHELMPPRSSVMVLDFSENYACSLQDEVQLNCNSYM